MNNLRQITRILLVCFGFLALIVLTISAVNARNRTKTNGVVVEITNPEYKFITSTEVDKLVKSVVDSVDTKLISQVNLREIEEKVEKNEYVDKCEAFINNQESLGFKIQQKQPFFRVIHENGVSYYVDKKGIKFSLSPTFTANVPIVTGKIVYHVDSLNVQQGKAINDLITFFNYTKTNDFADALVTSVDVQPNGDFVITPRTGKHLVNIGDINDLDDKFNRLTIFYTEGLNKIGWNNYSEVSLKFKDQIIAKKK